MKIDGKALAETINNISFQKVVELKKAGITPKIAIVTLGPEEAWKAYVGQKIKLAEQLNVEVIRVTLENPNEAELHDIVQKLDNDPTIHGIIIQRPFPHSIPTDTIIQSVNPQKDIDGFRQDSQYEVPSWLAVSYILRFIFQTIEIQQTFEDWLKAQVTVVVGKGETAGTPAINGLRKLGINPIVIDRTTQNPSEILQTADIIISAVGKEIVKDTDLKNGVILIGLGLRRAADGKLHGDYNESSIENLASFYTPSPGGVGPVNLAFLFQNLVEAASH